MTSLFLLNFSVDVCWDWVAVVFIKFKDIDVGWHKILTCRQVTHEQGNTESVFELSHSSSKCWNSEAAIYNGSPSTSNSSSAWICSCLHRQEYSHPLLFVGFVLAGSQLCGLAPRTKVHYSGPSVDRRVRIVEYFKRVLEPWHMMLNKMKETSGFLYSVYVQKKTKTSFGLGGQSVICGFSVCCRGSWNLNLAKSEGWVYCIL